MIKVAINIKPLESGHKTRGIGYYITHLLNELEKKDDVKVIQFREEKELADIDVVHYPWFDFFFRSLPIKSKFPRVITVHDVIPLVFYKNYPSGIKGKINLVVQKIALNNSSLVITDSEASKKDIKNYLGINENKIDVVYLAPDKTFKILKQTETLRLKMKYHLPDEFVLYVGDANYIKNLPFLLKGFIKLKAKNEHRNLKLVLIGQVFLKKAEYINHPELQSLKEVLTLIEDQRLESEVIRPGFISDEELTAFYNLATVYVQPSLYEGFGLPILQAFACGTPVVSSDAGSLTEVGGNAAVYFSPNNLEQFVKILEDVLISSSLRKKISDLGKKQLEKFSWKKIADQTINSYEKAIKK
ncbi:glycosyltransferase family 4 protein [Candidatus Daviesbacteria bacterium]|nr:glycosyltransferase family 4 protein [Candidatus Daviesbacteria bacterium]